MFLYHPGLLFIDTTKGMTVVTLGQIAIWVGLALLALFALAGYLLPAGILLGKWIVNRAWQSEVEGPIRVSLLSIWESWRTAFSYMFVFQTATMTLVWTLGEISSSHTYTQTSKIAASNLGLAAPAAIILTYTILEGVNGIMVSWAFYQELRRREEARRKAEIRASLEAEMEERVEADVQVHSTDADVQAIVDAEVKARVEAAIKASLEDEIQARVDEELERLRNGSAE